MTLVISKGITLRKTWQPMDADAAAYITAVETADGQALEEKTKIAIDNFVLGCKADGIWSAIKASCILAGARTLTGALVPLVGAAPTNVGGLFVSDDYNRKTGLVGDGSTKYLLANHNSNQDPRDNQHHSAYVSTVATTKGQILSASNPVGQVVERGLFETATNGFTRAGNSGNAGAQFSVAGLYAASRLSSANYLEKRPGLSASVVTAASNPVLDRPFGLYANSAQVSSFSDARLAFYSIGESLDLALLDARVTDLINAFAAAIP
jgi:hypothetical protein